MKRQMHTPGRQNGVMLIEALIGILIFSIGILAMMGMQATGMRATIDAKYRTEASFLANEIVGIMWSDAANLDDYKTDNCAATPACLAWRTRVVTLLPGVTATGINKPEIDVASRTVTITVKWQRPGETTPSNHIVVAQIYRASDA